MNKKEKCLDVAKTGGKDRQAGGEAPLRRPDGWKKQLLPVQPVVTSTKTQRALEEVNCEEIRRRSSSSALARGLRRCHHCR